MLGELWVSCSGSTKLLFIVDFVLFACQLAVSAITLCTCH